MRALRAPGEPIQLLDVEVVEDRVERHALDHARTKGRRCRNPGAPGGNLGLDDHGRAGDRRILAHILAGLADDLLHICFPAGVVGQRVHAGQPLECVLAVEDPAPVRLLTVVVEEERAPAEAPVDRRAANQDRHGQPAFVQLAHHDRHLLRGAHEQGGEADRVRSELDGFLDDGSS